MFPRIDAEKLSPKTGGLLVSACLIVRNEEQNLPRCLSSIQPLVDEIVAEDTGSTDGTVEILKAFGARVRHTKWSGDFALHRNNVLEMAKGRYGLIIDGDEEIVETNLEETRHHLMHSVLPPILLVRELLLYPGGKAISVLAPRIIDLSYGFRFIHPIHEQLNVTDAAALLCNVRMVHHGYTSEQGLIEKERRNLAIAKSMPAGDIHGLHCQARSAMALRSWVELMDACGQIISSGAPPMLVAEACALGAAGAFNSSNREMLDKFLEKGRSVAPESPDIRYVELLGAAQRYLNILESGDSDTPGDFLRPWLFWHGRDAVKALIDVLAGVRQVVIADKGNMMDDRASEGKREQE